jgi:CheY-like chemotaxis protein
MILAAEPDIEVIVEASNGIEAVALTSELHPDVVLMDIRMPERDGIEATRRILAQPFSFPLLVANCAIVGDELAASPTVPYRGQLGYSSLRQARGSAGSGFGVRLSRNEWYGATNESGAVTV